MAPMVGRPLGSKNKQKGDSSTSALEKYMTGGDEEWKKGLEKIIAELGEMRREAREVRKEMKEELENILMEERRVREEERRREKEEWQQEKKNLVERIVRLEWNQEKDEREKRKNKIVIKGVTWRRENLALGVEEFIKDKLEIGIKVRRADMLTLRENRSMVIADIESWEQKRNIMINKKKLERGVMIEDDLTRREREIQQKLREIAREERAKGNNNVRLGYKKIRIGEKWLWWNEREEKLVEERRRA